MADRLLFVAIVLAAVTLAQSLAHALELPGKLRLNKEQYFAVQTIYYPGFTIGGSAEPLSILAIAGLLLLFPAESLTFVLVAGALGLMIATQLLFWLVVQPVNRTWIAGTQLSGTAERFFDTGPAAAGGEDWVRLRDRWERGHLARSLTTGVGFILLVLAALDR